MTTRAEAIEQAVVGLLEAERLYMAQSGNTCDWCDAANDAAHAPGCDMAALRVAAALPPETAPATATATLLRDARYAILRLSCGHDLVCADPACREAGHEHETCSDGEGWGCGEGCPCIPACEGHEPDTCDRTTAAREVIIRIDEALAAPGVIWTGDASSRCAGGVQDAEGSPPREPTTDQRPNGQEDVMTNGGGKAAPTSSLPPPSPRESEAPEEGPICPCMCHVADLPPQSEVCGPCCTPAEEVECPKCRGEKEIPVGPDCGCPPEYDCPGYRDPCPACAGRGTVPGKAASAAPPSPRESPRLVCDCARPDALEPVPGFPTVCRGCGGTVPGGDK